MKPKNSIQKKLFDLSDESYKKTQERTCPNTRNIIGVRIPKLRNLAKEIAKEDYKNFLNNNLNEYFEEIMLEGFVIGYAKMELEERLKLVSEFVPKIDNWAVCDCCCSSFKFAEKNREDVWKFIQKYVKSAKEFEIRFAVIMMLDYYLTDEYIDKVFKVFDKIKKDDYYVKMGIAWAVAEGYIKQKEETKRYLEKNKLDKFTYNKAIQKMTESFRISDKEKVELKKMKR